MQDLAATDILYERQTQRSAQLPPAEHWFSVQQSMTSTNRTPAQCESTLLAQQCRTLQTKMKS